MRCAHCAAIVDPEDNFCRRCGAALNRRNLPTVVSSTLLPVPWTMVKGHLLRGAAALMVGTVMELVRRDLARRTAPPDPAQALAVLATGKPADRKRWWQPRSRTPRGEYEVSETVIHRRVRFFRR